MQYVQRRFLRTALSREGWVAGPRHPTTSLLNLYETKNVPCWLRAIKAEYNMLLCDPARKDTRAREIRPPLKELPPPPYRLRTKLLSRLGVALLMIPQNVRLSSTIHARQSQLFANPRRKSFSANITARTHLAKAAGHSAATCLNPNDFYSIFLY